MIAYTRVSTEEQATSGLGLASQEAAIRAEGERRGWDLVKVVADEGLTGKNLERPALRVALEMIAAGEADGLVASKLDRLSRSLIDFTTILAWTKQAKAALVVLDFDLDTSTPSGRLVAQVVACVAEWEAEVIADRTRQALAAKRARDGRLGQPAVTDNVDLSARITALRAAGSTLQAIADTLNVEGVPTPRGGATWRPSSVQTVLGYRRPPTPAKSTDLPDPRPRKRRSSTTRSGVDGLNPMSPSAPLTQQPQGSVAATIPLRLRQRKARHLDASGAELQDPAGALAEPLARGLRRPRGTGAP